LFINKLRRNGFYISH